MQPTTGDSALLSLYDARNLARRAMGVGLIKPALDSTSNLLDTIRESTADRPEYIQLEQSCIGVCEVLDRGTNRKQDDLLSQPALEAIEKLTTTVEEIKRNIVKQGKRRTISRALRPGREKGAIAAWRLSFNRILCILDSEFGSDEPAFTPDPRHEAPESRTPDVHLRGNSSAEIISPTASHDISDSRTATSQAPTEVVNIHALDRKIHRNVTESIDARRNPGLLTHVRLVDSTPNMTPMPGVPDRRDARGTTPGTRPHIEKMDTIAGVHEMINGMPRLVNSGASEHQVAAESSVPGESPPPPPKIFGRDELVKNIVDLADTNHPAPIALIGTGGIGKTSVAQAVLHDDRIKQRFGDHRRILRCDQFPASLPNFLRRLSEVIGAGISNPADLNSLRPFLSRYRMLIIVDNAESISGGPTTMDIELVVEELSQFRNICLCITSRTSIVPTRCRVIDVPTLSMEAARETFHSLYRRSGEQFDEVDGILKQLDFHPLSIILLATAAKHNKWDTGQLEKKWEEQRTGVLRTRYHGSLAATIGFSLHSPMFRDLGPHARDLLGVVAFFPHGVDENNLDWLFPSIADREKIFGGFCVLSLTHRDSGFITMLAPLRDHLCPKDPMSASLLCSVKEHYFSRLLFAARTSTLDNDETTWIASEDINVEHLLDIFTSIDANSESVWNACKHFMEHLFLHKPRLPVFGPKIWALPDDYPSKPQCLLRLSALCKVIRNFAEQRRLMCHALKLYRERRDSHEIASTLNALATINCLSDLCEDGIQQAREAMAIFQQLGDVMGVLECHTCLASLFRRANRLDDAGESEDQAIALFDALMPTADSVSRGILHAIVAMIHLGRGDTEKVFSYHEETNKAIPLRSARFRSHCELARIRIREGRFDDAGADVEHAGSLAVNGSFESGHVMLLRARLFLGQGKFKEARPEALRALYFLEGFGGEYLEEAKYLLHSIDQEAARWESTGELQASMARWITHRMTRAALGGDISQDEEKHKAITKLMALLEKDGNRPGGPHFFQITTAYNELSALMCRTRTKSLAIPTTVDKPDEIPPPEHLMRQDNGPVVLWTTGPKLEHVGQLWQALYHVPQVRHRISQYRSSHPPGANVRVDPLSSGTGGLVLFAHQLFGHMELSGLAMVTNKSLMKRRPPHRPQEGISPREDIERAYKEFSEQVEVSLNDGLATRDPDWPRLFHSRINGATSQERPVFDAREDFSLISLGYNDSDGSSDLTGCLKNQVFPEFPEQESLGTNHTTTEGCATMEAADVIAFALARNESPPSTSTVGSQQRRKFSFPESFRLDQFVMVSRPHVQHANVAEGETIRGTGSDLARKMDIMGSILSSLHYYENVARSPTDVERYAAIESSAAKLRNVIAHIDAEWNAIGTTAEQLKKESQNSSSPMQAQQNKYDLRAVLMHDGQKGRNHVYSYINHEDAWWKVVSYTVTKVALETVLNDENGMDVGAGPFFLIYSRSLSEPLKSEWPETLEKV